MNQKFMTYLTDASLIDGNGVKIFDDGQSVTTYSFIHRAKPRRVRDILLQKNLELQVPLYLVFPNNFLFFIWL